MEAKQTPLIELLERIPQDARLVVEHDQFSSSVHPVGRLCREAAAALAQQTEPAAGKVVAWGVFANIDGEWQLQHPVFAGDEQGKVNSEFERASYSGPQPLEVRPLGVVTATAQQDEPLNLRDPAVQKRLATQWGYVPAAQAEPVEPVATLTAQRDALLELVVEMDGHEGAEGWSEDLRVKINVAIKAVEEGK